MGYELRRWLADRLPEDCTSGERLVALEVADLANERTRIAYGNQMLDVLVHRTGLASRKQIGKVLAKLAVRGVELRVPVRDADGEIVLTKAGRPLFAYEGRKLTLRVPTGGEMPTREVPLWGEHSSERYPHRGSTEAERSPCGGQEVPPQGDPSPQYSSKTSLLKPVRPEQPPAAPGDEHGELADAIAFLEALPAPWGVGPKTAVKLAPDLLAMARRQGWQLDNDLAARLTEYAPNIRHHSAILHIRIVDLPRRTTPTPAAAPAALPVWCGDCADGNPAAAKTGHIRQIYDDAGNGRPCPKCHPSQTRTAA
ncbi:hypothetical protein H3146_05835 [Streptomyces sp. OF3]|uniref:Uncharacterized protein n=1 Tax=Streptomyces alkaliterrae TaxID=2213162 RepID=A0A7W3WIB0_9ACTN|nr:hypothetical protein [Streptomyces alkaliterrae]MBB1252887.1 hypothetical protein [Streptomyces alkaliterrae]